VGGQPGIFGQALCSLDLQMTDNNCEISDPDGNGWTVGDKITISNQYKPRLTSSRGDSDDVERDYIRPGFIFQFAELHLEGH
jgi:hypothetical protein